MLKYMLFIFYCSGLLAMEKFDWEYTECTVRGTRLRFSRSEARSLGIVDASGNLTNSIDIKHIPHITKKVDQKLGEFFEAIYQNKPKKIQELAKIININGQDPFFQFTPLMFAVYSEKASIVKLLLELRADVDKVNYQGLSALSLAIENKNKQILELILNASSNRDTALEKALEIAGKKFDKNMIRFLIAQGGLKVYEKNDENSSLLDAALHKNDLPFFKELLALGCNIWKLNISGNTLLMCACEEKLSNFAKYIIDQFSDKEELKRYISHYNNNKNNAFALACGSGSVECINLLIDNGVELTDRNINEGLFHALAASKSPIIQSHVIDILKKYSRPIEEQAIEDIKKITGKIRNKRVELGSNILTFLLLKNTNGFEKTMETKGEWSAFRLKAELLTDLLFLLVNLNEEINIKETKHCSVCTSVGKMQACGGCNWASYCSRDCQRKHWGSHKPYCKYKQLIDEAIKNHRQINTIDDNGQTLLHKAVIIGYHNLARVISKEINLSIKDNNGKTALDLAQENKDLTMIDILIGKDKDEIYVSMNGPE